MHVDKNADILRASIHTRIPNIQPTTIVDAARSAGSSACRKDTSSISTLSGRCFSRDLHNLFLPSPLYHRTSRSHTVDIPRTRIEAKRFHLFCAYLRRYLLLNCETRYRHLCSPINVICFSSSHESVSVGRHLIDKHARAIKQSNVRFRSLILPTVKYYAQQVIKVA